MQPSPKKELCQAQLERIILLAPYFPTQYFNFAETQNSALCLEDVIAWVDKASRSTSTLFKIRYDGGPQSVHYASLGRQLLGLLPPCLWLVQSHAPERRFDPRIELLLEVLSSRKLTYWSGCDAQIAMQQNPTFWIDTLNACIQEIRIISNRRAFVAELEKHRNAIDRRFSTLQAYFNQVDKSFPHSIVLRFDLLLNSTSFVPYTRSDERYDALRDCGADWLQQVQTALGPALVGHAWKHDFAPEGGFIMHAALVLNGPQGDEMPDIISMLTSTWVKASAGAGYWINCHAPPYLFEYRGLHDEATQHLSVRAELHNCAVYLAKTDGTMRLEFKEKPPTYGMGTTQPRLSTRKKQVQRAPQATQPKPIHEAPGQYAGHVWGSRL